MNEALKGAKILIVDDELSNVRLLEVILLQAGFEHVESTMDSRQTLSLFQALQPDLLLLDLNMPHMDGFDILGQLMPLIPQETYMPVLVLTADITTVAKQKALAAGAKDFLTKPFDRIEVLLRIENLLHARLQHVVLENRVRERTQDLEASQLETLQRLALAAEYRDDDTGLHTRRVGYCSSRIADALSMSSRDVDSILHAAPLHDVGKIGISDTILLKPGKLTEEEFATMKRHTVIGARILSGSSSPWLRMAEEIAMTHHERWDGSGYIGLVGEAIPLTGRIVAVADVFDALTHERPYKQAWPIDKALAEIEAQKGRQFDPQIVEAFLQLSHAELL
jgi:putative two-component system response regulator